MSIRRLRSLEIICLAALVFFLIVIFIPPVYVLTYAFKAKMSLDAAGKAALINSLSIGAIVTIIDVLFGLPVAWVLSKRENLSHRRLIDTLIDMPLVVPTSVLGLSVFYFWGSGLGSLLGVEGGLVSKGPLLIILLHVVFTFPYIVRSIMAAISQIDATHEQAARMLGASPLTVFRTVSMPLFKGGLVSGAILVFTRSLSETGATMMVAGLFETAPTMVVAYKQAGNIASAAAVSAILILTAIVLLILARFLSGGFKIPVVHVWPLQERAMSRKGVWVRDAVIAAMVLSVILLPTFYIVIGGVGAFRLETLTDLSSDQLIIGGIATSFIIGLIVTAVNLALAIPVGMLISRNMFRAGATVEAMSDIILIVPTSALGLSLALFWKGLALNELLVIILAHLSFTFPLMLKPIATALRGVDPGLEDAARTLKATPLQVFTTVVYPLVRPAIIAGVIMTFMRSLSETGATLSVSEHIKTIPVILVELFTKGQIEDKTVLACIMLFIASFAFINALKGIQVKNAGR